MRTVGDAAGRRAGTGGRRRAMPPTAAALWAAGVFLAGAWGGLRAEPPPPVAGLVNPESVAVRDGKIYVSVIGKFGADGDGSIVLLERGRAVPFATGLDDPKGLAFVGENLFVADKTRILKVDPRGKVAEFAPAKAFVPAPLFLNDLVAEADGTLYASDSGNLQGQGGKVFKITADGKVALLVEDRTQPLLKTPNGLLLEGPGKLLLVDFGSGDLLRIDVASRKVEKINGGFPGGDGLARDPAGRLLVTDWQNGKVFRLKDLSAPAETLSKDKEFQSAADPALSPDGKHLIVPDMKAGRVVFFPLPE